MKYAYSSRLKAPDKSIDVNMTKVCGGSYDESALPHSGSER